MSNVSLPFAAQEPDTRFAEAEAEVDQGNPWRREPNPLTIEATGWSSGITKLGEAEFLNGVDRSGKKWSVLVGSLVLRKRLIEGLVEEWDDRTQDFVVVETLGRVQPGEVVSIKFVGDVEGAKFTYPNFKVSRKSLAPAGLDPADAESGGVAPAAAQGGSQSNDIPFA